MKASAAEPYQRRLLTVRSHLEQRRSRIGGLLRSPAALSAPRRQRSAGTDAGEDPPLLVEGQVEQAKDDRVDEKVDLGRPCSVPADLAVVFQERLLQLSPRTGGDTASASSTETLSPKCI